MKDAKEIMEALLAGEKLKGKDYNGSYFIHLKDGNMVNSNGDEVNVYFDVPTRYEIYKEPESKVKQKWFRRKWILDLSSMTAFHPRYYSSKKAFDEDWNPNNYLKVSPEWEEIEI